MAMQIDNIIYIYTHSVFPINTIERNKSKINTMNQTDNLLRDTTKVKI